MRALSILLLLGLAACDVGPTDKDLDGYDVESDCDDNDPEVHPGATEVCNEVDDDCNGLVDDEPTDITTWYLDADADGYGVDTVTVDQCTRPSGHADKPGDCDDGRAKVNPEGVEVCDDEDLDEDCDGSADDADDSVTDVITWYADADEDGYGDPDGGSTVACDPGAAWAEDDTDCDDADPEVHPGAVDLVCDGKDMNCDGRNEGIATRGALEYFSVEDAVADASTGDTVTVCPGSHAASLVITVPITLAGYGGDPEHVVLSGIEASEAPVISVDAESFVLTGIGVHGGDVGGLDAEVGQLTLTDCRFESNQASTGGAVAVTFRDSDYAVDVERCHFEGNSTARSNAGGMFIAARGGETDIRIVDSVFQANVANKAGGALWVDVEATVELDIQDTTFSANSAASRGGAVFIEIDTSGKLTADLDNVVYEDNTAGEGAALAVLSSGEVSEVVLDTCTWTGNVSSGSGGAVLFDTSARTVVEVNDNTFTDNVAADQGGAMAIEVSQHGRVDLETTSFSGNTADQGGAISATGSNSNLTLTADTCSLDGNEATSEGGAMWLDGARLTLTGGEVINHTGGGAALEGNGGLISESADWGTPEVDDNDPWDVSVDGQGEWSTFETSASFECDQHGCSPA